MNRCIILLSTFILIQNCDNNPTNRNNQISNPPELNELVGYWKLTNTQIDYLYDDNTLDSTQSSSIDGEQYYIFTDSTYSFMGYLEQYSCYIPQLKQFRLTLSYDTLLIPEMDSLFKEFEKINGNGCDVVELRLLSINSNVLTENHFLKMSSDTAIELNIIYKHKYEKVSSIDTTNWPTEICD